MQRYRLLDTPPEERFDDIVAVAARLLGTPIALLSLIDERRQWFKAKVGLDVPETPRDLAFCNHAIRTGETLIVPDATKDPRFINNPLVTDDPGIRFYAGAPLITPDGHALGTVCVIDVKERQDFGAEEQQALEALSRLVVDHLELRRQAMLNAEMTQRAALREKILVLTAEAPDFDSAIRIGSEVLLETTGALFCHVFRLSSGQERIHFVNGAGRYALGSREYLDQLRNLSLQMAETPVSVALLGNRQVIERSHGALDLGIWPASGLIAAHGMAEIEIVTPFGLLEDRYAFALGLERAPADLDALAGLMADVTSALRPLLRRSRDEERARLFQRAVDASLDPVLITEAEPQDEPGPRILYANEAFTRETGYTAAEVIGRSPRMLQGPDTEPAARANIRRALKAWRPIRQEILNYHKDGSAHVIELNIAPVADSTGWYTHWISAQRDVTVRREAERLRMQMADELEHLIAGMPGALMRVGKNEAGISTALYSSPSIKTITGYAPCEIKPGFMAAHLSEADLLQLRASISLALLKGEAQLEFQFRHRDGRNRLIMCQLTANPTTQGFGEVIMSWSDITKERQLSDQLAQSAKLAQLGEVATGMAHEMNQPLASISLAAENALRSLARATDAPPRAREKLELIISLAQRASETIDHMRIFGRTGSGPSGPVAMTDVLAGVEQLVQAKLRQGGVRLVSKLPADLPPVLGKRIPLEQVMINLISNACDAYSVMEKPAVPERRCIAILGKAEGGRVIVQVEDHAGGIPADIMSRIFEPFFTTKDVGQGTGLGLSISYGIITDMGGTITAEGADGGTRFTIELRAALAA
ncbi:MAG: GAF domain-containing protein [Roseococcus sp.]